MNSPQTQPRKTERELFLDALERPTPGERAAFLEEACAHDPALRVAVEALLQNHKEDGFLETPAIEVPSVAASTEAGSDTATQVIIGEKPGDWIGRYKLLQQIGEGGVGMVFMAEQESPIRRRVALKVLKPGMDTKSVIARFESERQALALMDHPNIAKVLDAGSTDKGRPFFVMELVRGIRITDYCDQNRLPTRDRLTLFMQVCQAIQHAHQKGIIHRDIKPSNILVTLHDGVPVPKVIDFGIAKAVDQRLTDKTFFTEFQSFIGAAAQSPRLARAAPTSGERGKTGTTATRLWPTSHAVGGTNGRNRVAVGNACWTMTQGSSFLATLGFGTESLWDSWSLSLLTSAATC